MADVEKATLKKIGTLVEAFREQQARGYEILEEMQRLLAGEPGIAAKMKQVEGVFERAWEARYPGRYVWNYKHSRPAIKRLLAKLTIPEIECRIANYIRCGDPFYVQRRHEFALFESQNNRFASAGQELPELEFDAPADCKHQPRCTSDQEHTRRKSGEMRA